MSKTYLLFICFLLACSAFSYAQKNLVNNASPNGYSRFQRKTPASKPVFPWQKNLQPMPAAYSKAIKEFARKKNNLSSFTAGSSCTDSSFSLLYNGQDAVLYTVGLLNTRDGGILISGAKTDTIDNPVYKSYAFIAKLNSRGSVLWVKEYKDTIRDWFTFYKLFEDKDGDIIAAGTINYPVEIAYDADYFNVVTKLTPDGNIKWIRTFNSIDVRNLNNCKGTSSLFINSIEDGLNGDLLFCGTDYGCPYPMSHTVFLLDGNGKTKWDFGFMHAGTLTQGIGATLHNGNIVTSGIAWNNYSGGDNTIELHFVTLDYNNGNVVRKRAYKSAGSINEAIYKSFGAWDNHMTKLNNGHFYIMGELESFYFYPPPYGNIFGVLEFGSDLSFIKGYSVASDMISTYEVENTTSNICINENGKVALTLTDYVDNQSMILLSASIENGRFIKSKKIYFDDAFSFGNSNLLITNDNASLYLNNRNFSHIGKNAAELRKLYDSDTSQTQCFGKDSLFARINDLPYVPYDNLHLTDTLRNNFYDTVNNIQAYDIEFYKTDGCAVASKCDTLKIHGDFDLCGTLPSGTFTAYKNAACGAAVSWSIDTGAVSDISYPNDTSVHITFKKEWTGSLTASISGGACFIPATDVVQIHVQTLGTPLNLGPDTVLCTGNTITLHAGSFASYKWQNGSTDSVLQVTAPGTYYVSVKDYCSNNYSDTVVIKAASYTFSAGKDQVKCNDDSVTLKASTGFINYKWQPDYMVNSSAGISIKAAPDKDTSYIVTAEKYAGCFVRDTVGITVLRSSAINLGSDTSLCEGNSLLVDAGSGFSSYVWSTGETTQQIHIAAKNVYIINATAANGCSSHDTIEITDVGKLPEFTLGNDTTLCDGKVLYYNFNLPDALYYWSNGSTTNTQTISKEGMYWLSTSEHGCSKRDTVNVYYKPAPVVFLGTDTSLCEGSTLLLTAGNNEADYTWSDGSTGSTFHITSAGSYYVTANLNGCTGGDTIQVNYTMKPVTSITGDTVMCIGTEQLLHAVSNTPVSWLWQDGNTSPDITINAAGKYIVTASAYCGSSVDSIKVAAIPCSLHLPNAFTPNKDGMNDIFRIKYPGFIKTFYMIIYNRFGEKIFETHDAATGWDGSFKGKLQPPGVYVWYVRLINNNGREETSKGTVLLIK